MRLIVGLLFAGLVVVSCSSSDEDAGDVNSTADTESTAATTSDDADDVGTDDLSEKGPGGYGFDRSDPEAGVANIMAAFATDEATATCIHDAWGDVANVPPAELTPQLMTFEICGTSIFQLMTGDGRFTGDSDG